MTTESTSRRHNHLCDLYHGSPESDTRERATPRRSRTRPKVSKSARVAGVYSRVARVYSRVPSRHTIQLYCLAWFGLNGALPCHRNGVHAPLRPSAPVLA